MHRLALAVLALTLLCCAPPREEGTGSTGGAFESTATAAPLNAAGKAKLNLALRRSAGVLRELALRRRGWAPGGPECAAALLPDADAVQISATLDDAPAEVPGVIDLRAGAALVSACSGCNDPSRRACEDALERIARALAALRPGPGHRP